MTPPARCSARLSRRTQARRLSAVLLTALAAGAVPLSAQGLPVQGSGPTRLGAYLPLDSSREIPAVLSRPVTVRQKLVSLEDALQAIARQARLGISYGEDLARSDVRVNLSLDRVSAARALEEAVRGTGWQVLYTARGQVTVVRRAMTAAAPAATGELIGRISAPDGRPVAGASVVLSGATSSVRIADALGRFSISGVPAGGYLLQASAPGYARATQRSIVSGGSTSSVEMRLTPTVIELEELVAIGYGSARRQDLTGSIASVNTRQLVSDAAPSASVSTSLLGRVSGVQVVTNLGTPGASAVLQIRGPNSITASAEPLYVLDGIPISPATTPLNSIDTNTIESIQILKDASATAIYGARGANGVVLITTRRGARGQNLVSIESSYGLQKPSRFIQPLDAREFMTLVNDGLVNSGAAPRYSEQQIASAQTFDYPRAMLHDLAWRPQQSHALTVSGGDDLTRYLLSGNLLRQDGVVINSGFERAGVRLNVDRQVRSSFRIGASFAGSRSVQRVNGAESTTTGTSVTGLTAALMFDPSVPPRDASTGLWNERVVMNENILNPVAESTERRAPNYTTSLLGMVFADYDLLPGLVLHSTAAGNFSFGRSASFSPSTIATGMEVGNASQTSSERRELTNENTLTYRRPLGRGNLELLTGVSVQTSHYESLTASARGFASDALEYYDLGSGTVGVSSQSATAQWTLLSQLGRVNYNLSDRYLFTLTARRDGSSRFGANNKWAVFPSAAFAWRIIDEPFLRNPSVISDLKLRLSYGRTGNQAIGPYQSLAQLHTIFASQGLNTDVVTLAPTTAAGNPDLRWETQNQYNLGGDLGVLDNRVTLSAEIYQSSTENLLLNTQLPWTTGFSTQLRNVGAVRNRGLEVGVSTLLFDGDRFNWSTALNLAANRNRVTELYGGLRSLGAASSTQVGEKLNTFVGYRVLGLYQQGDPCGLIATVQCSPGEYRLQDTNGDRVINDDDRVNLGNPEPDFYGGFTSNLSYGPLSLDAYFNFYRGNEINNSSMRYLGLVGGASNERRDRALRRWTATNTDTDVPRANIQRPNNRTYSTYIEDGSFLRLQSLSLGFDLPTRVFPDGAVESARLTVSGQNLWIRTAYSGFDPEQQAIDPGGYPRARSWNIGLNVSF